MSDEITQLPDVGFRVGTGPVRFGDDWAGVFIRGDGASGHAASMKYAAKLLREGGLGTDEVAVIANYLTDFADMLDKCYERVSDDHSTNS